MSMLSHGGEYLAGFAGGAQPSYNWHCQIGSSADLIRWSRLAYNASQVSLQLVIAETTCISEYQMSSNAALSGMPIRLHDSVSPNSR